ncbi:flagellar export chaperone FliS [Deefgea sp. CFH1-16]|nr:flagellar export chaperone FliS [Deefgea sp. CFH1-16]
MKRAMAAYGQQSLDVTVMSASPHQLIVLLFEGAIKAANLAKMHLESKNIPAKAQEISRAIAIIEDGLRLSLDKNTGGELAENLDALYEYITRQFFEANVKNDIEKIENNIKLLTELKESWMSIVPTLSEAQKAPPAHAVQHGKA